MEVLLKLDEVIEADRLTLRPLRLSDTGPISLFAGDKRVARMTKRIPHPLPPGAAEVYVRNAQDPAEGETAWAMDASKSGGAEFVGLVSVQFRDVDMVELTYWVGPPFWQTGYAQEAVAAVLQAGEAAGIRKWRGRVLQENAGSAKVLTNGGFKYVGNSEVFSVARHAVVPVWLYEREQDA